MTPPPAASLSDRRDFEMTKKTFSGEIDRFGMTGIQLTLPGSKHHAAATLATLGAEASLRIAQDQGLRHGIGHAAKAPAGSNKYAEDLFISITFRFRHNLIRTTSISCFA